MARSTAHLATSTVVSRMHHKSKSKSELRPESWIGAAMAGFSHTDAFLGDAMRKSLFAGVSLVALGLALEVSAADLNVEVVKAPVPALVWNWAGLYIGAHVGGAWGTADFSDPFGTSVFGDKVRTPGFVGGGQVGYNWQSLGSSWVFGVEADISGFDSDGTNTCFAASALTINATCRVRPQLAGTFTGRIGYAVGASGHTLIYGKGGVAWVNDQIELALNAGGAPGFSTSNSQTVTLWGGTFGVGVEQALTSAWSLKVEYDYVGLGSKNVANLGAVSFSPTPRSTSWEASLRALPAFRRNSKK